MNSGRRAAVSPFRQPRGAWAVPVGCVVSFSGSGLIDPHPSGPVPSAPVPIGEFEVIT